MTDNNLVLTEKSIGRHTKRLQKELATINEQLTLSQAQNMFSRILGMKDYHHLKETLKIPEQNENLEREKMKNSDNLSEVLSYWETEIKTLKFAKEHLPNFIKKGDLNAILDYYKSNNSEVINYIYDNSYDFFEMAITYKQDLIINFFIEHKIILLNSLNEEQVNNIIYNLIDKNNSMFEHVFYSLKFPVKINSIIAGRWIDCFVRQGNLSNLKRFLDDDRISFQKNFFWNKWGNDLTKDFVFNFCCLNTACSKGYFSIVKYLIEKENIKPLSNGSTVQQACRSGNLKLVKYLIDDLGANYSHFEKNANINTDLYKKYNLKLINSKLDNSVLSSAILSNNLQLIQYLINDKNIEVSEYDHLALRTSLIENTNHYLYLLSYQSCKNYLKNNAQDIFEQIINKTSILADDLKAQYRKNQFQIVKYLYENYPITIKEVKYDTNNFQLIEYLKIIIK